MDEREINIVKDMASNYTKQNEMDKTTRANIDRILSQVSRKKAEVVINVCPKGIANRFNKWADTEFRGDRGMALKWLIDFYMKNMVVFELLAEQGERISRLEKSNLEKPKVKKMLGSDVKCT